jgi:hypothetical protein
MTSLIYNEKLKIKRILLYFFTIFYKICFIFYKNLFYFFVDDHQQKSRIKKTGLWAGAFIIWEAVYLTSESLYYIFLSTRLSVRFLLLFFAPQLRGQV